MWPTGYFCGQLGHKIFKGYAPKTFANVNWKQLYPSDTRTKIRFAWVKRTHDDLRDLNQLLRQFKSKKISRLTSRASFPKPSFINTRSQICTVKLNYGSNRKSHLAFLNTYMPQKNKDALTLEKPELFGNTSLEEYKNKMTGRHFKWILSPETQLSSDELKAFTRLFVQRMEQQTGRTYNWQAAVHTDTGHNHVHLVINGKDVDGNAFRFAPGFIKSFARENAQEILTQCYGERTREQIAAAKNRRLTASRFTEYDETISENLVRDEMMDERFEGFFPGRVSEASEEIKARLEKLKTLELSEYKDGKYFLKKNWMDDLRAVGRYNMYLDARKYVDMYSNLRLYTSDDGLFTGKIKHIYSMNDEDVWTNAVVIENKKERKAFYVPLSVQTFRKFKAGMEVQLDCAYNQRGKLVVQMTELLHKQPIQGSGRTTRREKGGLEY